MSKRNYITIALIATLAFGAAASAGAARLEKEEPAVTVAAPEGEPGKKGGNGFAKVLKAPFKAIGKLFGAGGDEGKPQRLSKKDVKRFEATRVMRTDVAAPPAEAPQAAGAEGAAELVARGREMIMNGRLNEAVTLLSRAAALDPRSSHAHSLLGVALDRKGLPQAALESFARAARIAPKDAQVLNNYGYLLFRTGDYYQAVERLKRAAKLAPDDQLITNNLALAQCHAGKHHDAYKSFARLGGEYKGRLNVALILERTGNTEGAIKYFEAARRASPGSPIALQHLIRLYEATGRLKDADAARRDLNTAPVAAGGGV